ncbi:MAG: hypothetical protein HY876_03075 [Coriobacteriales bacterium]|nr:hypothetical protein [Coriobacteriales bacterium]
MEVNDVLVLVLIVAALGLTGVAAWASVEVARTARSVRQITDQLDGKFPPLIDKADASLDLLNAEMMRIDGIVSQVEEVSDRMNTTSETVNDVVRAPLAFIVGFADRVRRAREQRAD